MFCKFWSIKRRKDRGEDKFKKLEKHDEFLSRINKTLYYGKLPTKDRLSLPISELAAELFSGIKKQPDLDKLNLDDAAKISREACISPCSFVLAILYLEKLRVCNPDYLHKAVPSELFLVSLMIASKFLNDNAEDEVFNEDWAHAAEIEIKEINRIEREFLQAINWEVFVSNDVFWKKLDGLEKDLAFREGSRRGWFTYTDMEKLLKTIDLSSISQALILVTAVCITSYTYCVFSLLAATQIASYVPGTLISQSRTNRLTPLISEIIHSTNSNESNPASQELPPNIEQLIISSISSCSGNETDEDLVSLQRHWSHFVFDWISVNMPHISLDEKSFDHDERNYSKKSLDLNMPKNTHESFLNWIPYFTKWLKLSNHRWIQKLTI